MPTSIDINVNGKVIGGAPQTKKPGGTNEPGVGPPGKISKEDADAAKKLAAAQREATKATGKMYSPEQIKISSDYFKEISRNRTLLKSYNGDLERFIRDFRNNSPSQTAGSKQFTRYMQEIGLGGPPQPGGGMAGMVKTAFGGMFRAAGMGGGTAGAILRKSYMTSQEEEGGPGSAGGMGMLAKGAGVAALAYVGIKAVQKIGQKVGDAQDEATQYHDLRASVGGAAVGFNELRESVRLFTNGMGISSAESAKLAKQYAASSQIFGESARFGIGQAVGQGTQLARGFGLAPESGVDFLATMRHFQASDGEKDNRKLAWLIGDAVGKTGAFSKADDVMNAIAHFTESTSRQSLQVANVEGYAELMGKLGGMKLPGMDAKGSASLMGQVAGNWANGGGEPGLNMRLGWAQRFGANATDMGAIGDAGPWASAESTFGKGSPLYGLANGDKARQAHLLDMAKRGGSESFYDQEMSAMKDSVGNPEFLPMTVSAKYGVSDIGARSLIKQHDSKGGISGLRQRVTSAVGDKDVSKIGIEQMGMLAGIDQADSKELAVMKEKALGLSGKAALTVKEKESLNDADTEEGLKKVLMQINAFREIEDEGKTARQAQIDLDRKFQEFATKIIPLTNMIQEGVFKILDLPMLGGLSPEMKRFQATKRLDEKLEALSPDDKAGRKSRIDGAIKEAKAGPMSSTEERDRRNAILSKVGSSKDKNAALDAITDEKNRREVIPDQIRKLLIDETSASSNAAAVQGAGTRETRGKIANQERSKAPARAKTTDEGRSRQKYLMMRLMDDGYSKEQAAGIVGSLMQESTPNLDPNAKNPDSGAEGIAQWLSKDRVKAFKEFTGKGIKDASLEEQTNFMLHEMRKRGDRDKLLKTTNPEEAAVLHEKIYEIAGTGAEHDRRIANGYSVLNAYETGDKSIPDTARAANAGSQVVKIGGSADINVNYPNGSTEKTSIELTGFQQTSAGMSRG